MENYNLCKINFDNVNSFIEAVDINNEQAFNYYLYRNEYISSFLATADFGYFCKNSKKILKKIDFEELLLDIQATLMLHDSIKSLIDPNTIKMYQSYYWEDLYKDMPSTSNGYEEFITKYMENFSRIIDGKIISSGQIIYIFLTQTLEYVDKLYNNPASKKALDEYNHAIEIPNMIAAEKENIVSKNKIKTLFKKIIK